MKVNKNKNLASFLCFFLGEIWRLKNSKKKTFSQKRTQKKKNTA
jgi:hypothetical protein